MPFGIKTVLPVLPKPDNLILDSCVSKDMNSIEDKELRKKLRNRQSALAARERKKARMLELERKVDELQQSNNELVDENSKLKRTLSALLYAPTEQSVRDLSTCQIGRKANYPTENFQTVSHVHNAPLPLRRVKTVHQAVNSPKYANIRFVADQQQFGGSTSVPIDYSMQPRRKRTFCQQNVGNNTAQIKVIKMEQNYSDIPIEIDTQLARVDGHGLDYGNSQANFEAKHVQFGSVDHCNNESKDAIRARLHSSPSTLASGYQPNLKRALPPIGAVLQSPLKTVNTRLDSSTTQSNVKTNLIQPTSGTNSAYRGVGNPTVANTDNLLGSQPEEKFLPDRGSDTDETLQRDPYMHQGNDSIFYQTDVNSFQTKSDVAISYAVSGSSSTVAGNYTTAGNDENALYIRLNENLTGYSPLDSISSCDSGVGIDDDSLEWIQKVPIF
uniref:uncharacterized protein LOC120335316 n=1 Tax=Styela clava TaxID=7725 RepID=UPI0019395C82|nr:uncharacterized protein LOC120335316 [Styela clava]